MLPIGKVEKVKDATFSIINKCFSKMFEDLNMSETSLTNDIKKIMDSYKVEISYTSIPVIAICDTKIKEIILFDSFFNQSYMDQISTLIHEYAHAISYELAGNATYDMLEEGFADFFAEFAIDNWFQDRMSVYRCSKNYGYINCRELMETIMFCLEDNRLTGIFTYLFASKSAFDQLCIKKIGDKYRNFLVSIKDAEINSDIDMSESFIDISRKTLVEACSSIVRNSNYRYSNSLIEEITAHHNKTYSISYNSSGFLQY